jgi:voltage-gated sodium channel
MIKKLFLSDSFILLLILFNATIIFVSGFNWEHPFFGFLPWLDNCITLLFCLELAIKWMHFGRDYFKSYWNWFDTLLVVLALPSFVIFLFGLNYQGLEFFLIFRVLRIFKSFRFLRFIPGIDHLIAGVIRALKSSVIVMLGFAVYIFIVGILSFYLYKDIAPAHFGDPLIFLYSTFKIFTIEGWFDIPEEVIEGLSPSLTFLTYLYFIFVVLSGGILGLSLVNSIFVDAMVSDNTDALESKVEQLNQKIDLILSRLPKEE